MVIVTGAAGFIGSQIALNLAAKNEKLVLVDHLSAFDDRKYIDPIMKHVQFIDADGVFLKQLPKLKPDWIIHMGAITNTAETDLGRLKKWNVDYSKSIWEYCTDNQINLIYASSAATYGNGNLGFSDDHSAIAKLKPLNPYGQSKQEFDQFVLSQTETPPHWYGLKYFNVYGPHEEHKGRMASAVWHGFKEIQKTGSMTLFKSHNSNFKDGDQARDFIFVGDVLEVVGHLMKSKPASGIYNLGSGRASTFLELANSLFSNLSKPVKINWVDTPQEFRAAYQYKTEAQTQKIKESGFKRPFTPLREGVASYLDFLRRT